MLKEIDSTHKEYGEAQRLIKFLEYFDKTEGLHKLSVFSLINRENNNSKKRDLYELF